MKRLGFGFLLLFFFSCSNKGSKAGAGDADETTFNYESFAEQYKAAALPYQLSDTGLLKNSDTTRIPATEFRPFVTDSILKKLFGKKHFCNV